MSNYGNLFPPRPSDLPTRVTKQSDAEPYRPKRTRIAIFEDIHAGDLEEDINFLIGEIETRGGEILDVRLASGASRDTGSESEVYTRLTAAVLYREPLS